MESNKDEDSKLNRDADFIDGIENLDGLGNPDVQAGDDDEDFDFDGHDVTLDAIPSWIDEDKGKTFESDDDFDVPTFASPNEPLLDEGFTLDVGEALLQDPPTPDSTDLFAPAAEISEVQEQRDAYLNALRQLQADFENYKKRVIRDNQEYAEMKSMKLMEELLPVIDNFQLALNTIDGKDPETEKLRKGIELVYGDLYSVLERQGLEPIDAEGALFDPEFHDAVAHEHIGEHEHEVVVEVLRPGYKVRGRVVRPAMVKVAQ